MSKPKYPIKVLWLQGDDTLRKVDYFASEAEAERAIVNSKDRGWGRAVEVRLRKQPPQGEEKR